MYTSSTIATIFRARFDKSCTWNQKRDAKGETKGNCMGLEKRIYVIQG